jgi:predicted HAD superfamily Cof-like phosphohydrolase
MKTNFNLIQEFHKDFGRIPDPETPTIPNKDSVILRAKLISEEYIEVLKELGLDLCELTQESDSEKAEKKAIEYLTVICNELIKPEKININKLAKELADLLVVVYGTAAAFGIPMDDVYKAVHDSNMSKKTKDGKVLRREDGKILKSDQYHEPVIKLK